MLSAQSNPNQFESSQGIGRLLFLGMASMMLCMSVVMAIFTPFPMALAIVLYGRTKGLALVVTCIVTLFALTKFLIPGTVLAFFVMASFFGAVVAEIVLRRIHPVKGLVAAGTLFCLLTVFGAGVFISSMETPVHKFLTTKIETVSKEIESKKAEYLAKGEQDMRAMLDLFSRPDLIATKIIHELPSSLFMGVFFWLWVILFLLLRSTRFFPMEVAGQGYSEKDLLDFRVKDWTVWILIPALVIALVGDKMGMESDTALAIGLSVIKGLGIFYFFQGFGVYLRFLDHIKLFGFFRSFLVMFTVISVAWLLALVGLLDMWFDFKNYFKRKENENSDENE